MILKLLEDYHTYKPERHVAKDAFPVNAKTGFFLSDTVKLQYLFVRKPGKNLIIQCHGNAANLGTLGHFYEIYEELGFSYLIFDYPGYGNSSGRPSEAGLYKSLESAVKFATDELNFSLTQIVLHGISLGGAVAIHGLTQNDFACAVIDCTFTSNRGMAKVFFPYLPLHKLIPLKFDSVSKISQVATPVLFISAENDKTCPAEMTRELFQKKPGLKEYLEIPGATHVDHLEVAGVQYVQRFREFVLKYL